MTTPQTDAQAENGGTPAAERESAPPRELSPEARRALAEAAERRRLRDAAKEERPTEIDGREGPEPVRYGDWEVKGIASDF